MGTIAELIARQGDIAGNAALQKGQIWGNAVSNLGQIGAQAVGQYQEQKEVKKRDQALTQLVDSGLWQSDPKAAFTEATRILGPREGPRFFEGLAGAAKLMQAQNGGLDPGEAVKALPMMARGVLAAPESMRSGLYGAARRLALGAGLASEDQIPADYSPELAPWLQSLAGDGKEEGGFSLSPGQVRFDASGKQVAAAPAEQKAPPKTLAEIEAESAARARGTRMGNPPEPKPPTEYTFNPEGVVLSSYSPTQKNEVRRQAMERGLPVFENTSTQVKGVTLLSIYRDAAELGELLKKQKVKDSIGFFAGRKTGAVGRFVDLDPEVQRARSLMLSLSDSELRKRSGASINEKEFQRLLGFTTDPNGTLQKNATNVAGLFNSAAREYKALSGFDPITGQAATGGVPAGASGSGTADDPFTF